jgi:ethanolamine utilization protein EutQ (cupin superfamily)
MALRFERRGEIVQMPPNKSLQLTVKSVSQFAYANWSPLFPAAELRR